MYSRMTKKLIIPVLLLSIILTGCTTTKTIVPQACTEEAKICPNGSAVGRSWPNCEFAPCPGETWSTPDILPTQECDMDAKLCPDGSAVGRSGLNCEFTPCPEIVVQSGSTQPIACAMDAKVCPDGSTVGRSSPNCEFTPCPGE